MAWNDGLKDPSLSIAATDASPLRVRAGPGTGKTFTLIRRIARLLENDVEPNQILVCTFTRTAADDLKRELMHSKLPGHRLSAPPRCMRCVSAYSLEMMCLRSPAGWHGRCLNTKHGFCLKTYTMESLETSINDERD